MTDWTTPKRITLTWEDEDGEQARDGLLTQHNITHEVELKDCGHLARKPEIIGSAHTFVIDGEPITLTGRFKATVEEA